MDRQEFAYTVRSIRETNPTWFDLDPDQPLEAHRRREIEEALGAQLPEDYVWFLAEYGGGDFAFASVFSADEASDLFLLRNQDPSLANRAVAFSEDGTGNLFVFPVVEGVAEDWVLIYDHETEELRPGEDLTFLDFLNRVGLRGAA